jgi:hypothetical protein
MVKPIRMPIQLRGKQTQHSKQRRDSRVRHDLSGQHGRNKQKNPLQMATAVGLHNMQTEATPVGAAGVRLYAQHYSNQCPHTQHTQHTITCPLQRQLSLTRTGGARGPCPTLPDATAMAQRT